MDIVITLVISMLIILPVIVLYQLSNLQPPQDNQIQDGGKTKPSLVISLSAIVVLVTFTILFCGTMAGMTSATRQELFAASAAYCAVLVVFIGNFSGSSG